MASKQQEKLCFLTLVVCFLLTSLLPAAGVRIRLSGAGSAMCSGRVELYHNNSWGTVCDHDWDLNDAEVACRQMGCGSALRATNMSDFGRGTGPILLNNVACSGNESSLAACQHRGFGRHNCGHDENAGVICSVPLWLLLTSVAASSVVVVLVVLLLLLSGVRLLRRRRQQAKGPEAIILSQVAVGNNYDDDDDYDDGEDYVNIDKMDIKKEMKEEEDGSDDYEEPESDEDHDYENAGPADNCIGPVADKYEKKTLKEEVGSVEEDGSDDYEEPEGDEDHDYEDAGPANNYIESKEVFISVEDYRDDEAEDDDEDDYENINN